MPIYRYRCERCDEITSAIHRSTELLKDCEKCLSANTLIKMIGEVHIKTSKNEPGSDTKVGDLTHQFIKDNREILKQQKEEAKKKQYDKS